MSTEKTIKIYPKNDVGYIKGTFIDHLLPFPEIIISVYDKKINHEVGVHIDKEDLRLLINKLTIMYNELYSL